MKIKKYKRVDVDRARLELIKIAQEGRSHADLIPHLDITDNGGDLIALKFTSAVTNTKHICHLNRKKICSSRREIEIEKLLRQGLAQVKIDWDLKNEKS